MNLSPCECEAELLWVCASPCVGEHTHLWLSALVGHFMSLCVNRNEILEWPFSRTLYFFYTLVSERQYSGALFFWFFSSISSGFPGERFVGSRYWCTVLAVLPNQPDTWVELVPPYIQCNQAMSQLCATMWIQAWKGCASCSWWCSLSPGSDKVWLFFLRVLLAIFTAIWRTIWI